jgi:DNA-binding beta-propeller fold protein YncE
MPIFMLISALVLAPVCYAADVVFVAASPEQFNRPHDLTLSPSGKYLFVADMNNDSVKILDPQNLNVIGEFGKEDLNSPHDVEFDAEERLIVADSGNRRLVIYTLNGLNVKKSATLTNSMHSPEGVAVSKHGDIYVANTGGHNVVHFKGASNNKALNIIGKSGRGEIEFIRPHDLEIWHDRLYVTDPGNNRIKILSLDLQNQRILGGSAYDFNEPKYLALDEQGRLYIADQYNDRIQIFAAYPKHNVLIASITSYAFKERTYYLDKPEGVEVRGDHIWIADTYNDRILLYKWSK